MDDEDLKIVLTSELEADEQASAQRITAQLPNIEKLVNAKSKIKIGVELNSGNIQSEVQSISKQMQSASSKSKFRMSVDINSEEVERMVERLHEMNVPNNAIRDFVKNIDEANIGVRNIQTSFDSVRNVVTAVISGIDRAGEQITQIQSARIVEDEDGNSVAELTRNQVTLTKNYEQLAAAEAKEAAQAKADNESRISYLTKQKSLLEDIQASYSGDTSVKPVKDDSHLTELKNTYSAIETQLNGLMNTDGQLSKVQRANLETQISDLKRLAKEYQNVEYVATKLRTKDIGAVKEDQFAALDTLEKRLERAGILTDDFKNGIEALRTSLNSVGNKDQLVGFLDSFDQLNNEISVFQERLRGANSIYSELIRVESQIAKTQVNMVGLDSTNDKDSLSILQQQLAMYEQQRQALNEQLTPYANITQYAKQAQAAEKARLENSLQVKLAEAELADQAREVDTAMERIPSTISDLQTRYSQLSNRSETLVENMRLLRETFESYGDDMSDTEKVTTYERLKTLIGDCRKEMSELMRVQRGDILDAKFTSGLEKAKADLKAIERQWSAFKNNSDLLNQFNQLGTSLQHVNNQMDLTKWTAQFSAFKSEVKAAGLNVQSFGDTIKNNAQKVAEWALATMSIYDVLNRLRSAIDTIKDLDTAMIDLQKVTDATETEYRDFYLTANDTAKQLGATTEEIISQTAEWARLGYALSDASELAKNSAIFSFISEDLDLEASTDGLVSILKAFDEIDVDDAMDGIISKINSVGKKVA